MKGLRGVLYATILIICTHASNAAYMSKVPVTVRQPDGTIIRCFATGDEFHNWLHDKNNFTIMQDPGSGFYVYATAKAGQLRPTPYMPGRDDPGTAGLIPGLNITREQYSQRRSAFLSGLPTNTVHAPTTGTINNIVVFIRFKDEGEFTDSVAYLSRVFNSSISGDNSIYNYFMEVSYNRLSVLTTFYPLVNGDFVLSYQDDQVRDYYRVYNAVSNPVGYKDSERYPREQALLTHALDAIRSQIPPTLNIDADNDGFVDNVCFIVSGSQEGWSSLRWPHMSGRPGDVPPINGKNVNVYNLQLRTNMSNGVLCHEFLHSLGAPDLYEYYGGHDPVDYWDIMAATGDPPQHPLTYLKYKYLHWISSIPDITTSGQYSLAPTTSATNNAYRIASPNSTTEYFQVEYRRKTPPFGQYLPGEGLIVYRINTLVNGNASGPPDEVYVYRPDGTATSEGSAYKATFSSGAGRTMMSDSTNPSSFLSDNAEGGLYISDIGNAGNTITFNYQKPGFVSMAGDNLALGQSGTVTVVIISPKTAEYAVEVRDSNGTGVPPWIWTDLPSSVQVSAGRHYAFSLTVQPTSAEETFQFSLTNRDIGGSWGTFASQQVILKATSGGRGTIVITTADAEGWPGPYDKAIVRLLDSSGREISSAKTDSASTANFADVPPGANYSYKVFQDGFAPFGEQYWGSKGGVTVAANETTNDSFVRNAPYAAQVAVYDSITNVPINSRDTIAPGSVVRIELIVKNPSYPGSLAASSRARLLVDRDLIPSYDFEQTSPYQSYSVGQSRTIAFTFTPTAEGTYFFAAEVLLDMFGFELTTDAGGWGKLFAVRGSGTGTGDLNITVSDAEDWGGPSNCATIRLLNNSGSQIGLQTTDATSSAIFSGVPTGSGYSYKVHFLSNSRVSPFGEQYWGQKTGIVIARGATTYESFTRNMPYALAISAYDSLTGVEISYDTVQPGSTLRIDLQLKNPAYAGAQPETCRARLVFDRDQIAQYDLDQTTELVTLGVNEVKGISFYMKPNVAGPYFAVAAVSTQLAGTPTVTDAGVWKGRPLVIIEGIDTSPPPPPTNLAATPSTWSNVNSFSLDWVNPIDESGIAAAWWILSSAPTAARDGIRSTAKPTPVVATATGGQVAYVWLEDSLGNVDHSTARTTMLLYDDIPPTEGRLLINASADSTASLIVTLNSSSVRDSGGSGIASMRFSNNANVWSEWESFLLVKNDWDLSLFGGSSAEGTKVVSAQFKDHAGNISGSFKDTIDYLKPDQTAPPAPQALVAAPARWSNVNSFKFDWTNPPDPSGIAAAWYKRATPPVSNMDGTRTTAKPFSATATIEGGQIFYLWLEDGSGNRDCNNRSSIQVFLDQTPPSDGTISINTGAPSTTTIVVSLNGLGAHDAGGSGLTSMRFSNDDSTWAPWESVVPTRPSWDLSEFGGNSTAGSKRVYVQYGDSAGNRSISSSDDISYTTSSVQMFDETAPTTFALLQNYPNPFNPSTSIVFQVPFLVPITLHVHNLLGENVATLLHESLPQGRYKVIWDAKHSPSGIYFVRMTAGRFVQTRRLLLLR